MEIQVDDSLWPVVRLTYGSEVTASEVELLVARLAELTRARGPMVLVSDVDALDPRRMAKELRAWIAQPRRQTDALERDGAILAEAVVTRSPVRKGIFMAYLWVRKSKLYPTAVFADHASALAWANAQLDPR